MENMLTKMRKKIKQLLFGNTRVFDDIYSKHAWGVDETKEDKYSSGDGSNPDNAEMYKKIIIDFISSRNVNSVLDIGCGDFRVSGDIIRRLGVNINWTAIDVSKLIIERNRSLHEYENVNFVHMDATQQQLPKADLVLVREVMQHLSNADIIKLIKNIPRGVHIIATNTIPINCLKQNGDIATGAQSRAYLQQGIFLNLPPFNIRSNDLGEWEHTNMTSKFICQEIFPDNPK